MGAMGLLEMRGMTTGTALGKKKNGPKHCQTVHFLPSSGPAYTNTLPESQDFDTYYIVSPSVCLCLNPSFLSHPVHLSIAFSAAPQDFCGADFLFSCYRETLQCQGGLCKLLVTHMYTVHSVCAHSQLC